MNAKTKAVTTQQTFYVYDDVPVFCVNAGVPTDDAHDIASNLMLLVERLAAVDAFPDRSVEVVIIQYLSEMARALNLACKAVARAGIE